MSKHDDNNFDLKSLITSLNAGVSEFIKDIDKLNEERKISNETSTKQLAELNEEIRKHEKEYKNKAQEEHAKKLEELKKSHNKRIKHFNEVLDELAKVHPTLKDDIESLKQETNINVDRLYNKYKWQ